MNSIQRRVLVLSVSMLLCGSAAADALRVYVGTYTNGKSKGIYVLDFDSASGKVSEPRVAVEAPNPSFITVHPTRKYLYSVSEAGKGTVSAYSISADGSLKLLNHQASGGNGPCFVSTDPTGRVAMVANYGSGSFESLPINEDGSLGEPTAKIQDSGKGSNPSRQEGPHAHSINADPAGKFAFACDLGLDVVNRFNIDTQAQKLDAVTLKQFKIAAGSGPRHLVFHPSGKFVYVVNEMGSNVTAFGYDAATGDLTELQTASTLPEGFKVDNTCAEVQAHPSGKFLYASNRGDDSIAVFSIDPASGKLTPTSRTKTGGKVPRNFRLDPSGAWLFAANQNGGGITVFKVDPETGALTGTGTTIDIASPVCVKFLPMEK
jgi:6-phosphogluconolactonase